MKIMVTGGCGYKGSVLVPKLLKAGHQITVVDTCWFGNFLKPHENLTVLEQDVLNVKTLDFAGVSCVIHLASIANDPTGDLNPKLTWETSCLATMKLLDEACRSGVSQFIYASSGSVYGLKTEKNVTEDLPLIPLSEYNKTKMVAERCALSYSDKMSIQILRPATVCGLSPRMRFDVSVNLLTLSALVNKKITVFGGEQTRPNVHIEDITDAYLFFLNRKNTTGVFNIGFENLSILQIAETVQRKLDVPITITESNDPRSYRVNSEKILREGFKPRFNVEYAIDQIVDAYNDGRIKDDIRWRNLDWMRHNNFHKVDREY